MVLDNGRLRATVIAELGGNIGSLKSLKTGREFLLAPEPARAFLPLREAMPFEEGACAGFDECFPTVAACSWAGTDGSAPDHGELWSRPWDVELAEQARVRLSARGRRRPYRFVREASLRGDDLILDYSLVNEGAAPMAFLWSAHPLLAVSPGDEFRLPDEVSTVRVEFSSGGRLGTRGEVRSWAGLGRLGPSTLGGADKLFTPRLKSGWAAVDYAGGRESLTLRFDPAAVPFLGIWLCQGGWPFSREPKHYTAALEPCTAPMDSLEEAIASGQANVLPPQASQRWSLAFEVRQSQTGIAA